jgi:hypothetical protein
MTFNHSFDLPHHNGHTPPDLDRKSYPDSIFDDPDPLEPSLLDSSIMSPSSADRRDSFATSTPFFSPQSSGTPWDDSFPTSATSTTLPERQMSVSSHFGDASMSNNPFYNHQQSGWFSFDRTADSRTPVAPATYVPFTGEFDGPTSSFPQAASAAPSFGGGLPVNVRPAAIMPPTAGATPLPTSPPPGKEWMAMAEQDNLDAHRIPKRIRQNSPPRSLSPGFPRREGVRKKNARFEIPPERSLANIDQLISQCENEDDVKELKQQKRLLRNRQAAYVPPDDLVLPAPIIDFGFYCPNMLTYYIVSIHDTGRRNTLKTWKKRRSISLSAMSSLNKKSRNYDDSLRTSHWRRQSSSVRICS